MTISKERVIEIANEIWDADKWAGPAEARLQRFAQAIRNEALEEVAAWIELQRNDVPANGFEFAAPIRNLKEQQ